MIVHDLITTGAGQRHGGPFPAEQRWVCVVSLKVAVARLPGSLEPGYK